MAESGKGAIPLSFSHLGIHVSDLPRMEDFYTRVLGFTVTDRGMARETGRRYGFGAETGGRFAGEPGTGVNCTLRAASSISRAARSSSARLAASLRTTGRPPERSMVAPSGIGCAGPSRPSWSIGAATAGFAAATGTAADGRRRKHQPAASASTASTARAARRGVMRAGCPLRV